MPQKMSHDLAEKVIERVLEGMSSNRACKALGISLAAFRQYVDTYPDLYSKYIRAGSLRADGEVENIIDISDDETIDPHRARNMIDARKHYAACMNPQRFGNRIDLNVTQIVDIGAALKAANERAKEVMPASCLQLPESKQVIDLDTNTSHVASGLKPDAEPMPIEGNAGEKPPGSIFD